MNDAELLNAIKNDMGLEGKGIGKRKYVKSGKPRKPRAKKAEKLQGGFNLKDMLKAPATLAKIVFPPAALPLKMVGLGKKKKVGGDLDEEEDDALENEDDRIEMRNIIRGRFLNMPIEKMREYYNDIESRWYEDLPQDLRNIVDQRLGLHNLNQNQNIGNGKVGGGFLDMIKLPLKLIGLGANGKQVKVELSEDDKNKLFGSGLGEMMFHLLAKINPIYALAKHYNIHKLGKGYSAAGYSAAGVSGGKKTRGRPPKKDGGNLFRTMAKIANISPFTSMSTDVIPMMHILGKDNVQNAVADIVEKMNGGKKKLAKKANKKLSKRALLVKKVMAEKGISMIEASKYIKANGLKF